MGCTMVSATRSSTSERNCCKREKSFPQAQKQLGQSPKCSMAHWKPEALASLLIHFGAATVSRTRSRVGTPRTLQSDLPVASRPSAIPDQHPPEECQALHSILRLGRAGSCNSRPKTSAERTTHNGKRELYRLDVNKSSTTFHACEEHDTTQPFTSCQPVRRPGWPARKLDK